MISAHANRKYLPNIHKACIEFVFLDFCKTWPGAKTQQGLSFHELPWNVCEKKMI